MDPVDGSAIAVAVVDPEPYEGEVDEGEEEEEGRELGLTCGEEILGSVEVEVEELGADLHGDAALRGAVGEEEGVLVRGGDRVAAGVGGMGRRGELAEGEEEGDVAGLEDAGARVALELEQDLEEGLVGEEEEAEATGREEAETSAWPETVKPNFSKRIMEGGRRRRWSGS